MDIERDRLSVEVAKRYYQLEQSQQEIATALALSRPTVSRLLQHAKDRGFVKITIADPFNDAQLLSHALKERYSLREVVIVPAISQRDDVIRHQLSEATAEWLTKNVHDNQTIGVSWGKTMYEIAQQLPPQTVKNVKVVQLKGGASHHQVETHAHETLHLFSKAFHTEGIPLPLPVIFEKKEVKQLVEEDRFIKETIQMGKKADVALYTVGTVRDEALLFRLNYLTDSEKKGLQTHAVGDICSRFFNESGSIANPELNERTIGISLDALRDTSQSVLIAGGIKKREAILGALCGRYCNVLIIDHTTAASLI
ncbi:sugar-binding transcriptional regulator [Vagococcus lutrae]|uniref:sugar-binding transcriptional regulator n=1 Tax=Vagococcus lutrae TaxID=81947 RepID=UPI0020106D65|nr:sugar-binding transcriptional regulator [Vagococcus lutrae]UQF11477.1 sugar-binding transcriptional regulator [Vagococcus lutrae]UQF71612.1 sugar-binding transcriptional regulator [Vagococcus lutrae]